MPNLFPEMAFEIESVPVTAQTRRISAEWGIEPDQLPRNTMTLERLRELCLTCDDPLTEDPSDITIDKANNCLYISGHNERDGPHGHYADDLVIYILDYGFNLMYKEPGTLQWSSVVFCEDFSELHGFVYTL